MHLKTPHKLSDRWMDSFMEEMIVKTCEEDR